MPTLIVIAGPTASGKSSLAIHLAKYFSTEILSADSRQFYNGLDIGTAKPNHVELAEVKHHFINSLELRDDYSTSQFEKDAIKVLDTIFSKNENALLAGGSGLYIRAVCDGIDELPGKDEETRKIIQDLLEKEGIESLKNLLHKLDPEYYASVDLANPHRLIRALEVCMVSGKKYSDFRTAKKIERSFQIIKIGLLLEREELYNRIDSRVDEMIRSGLIEEARKLLPYRNLNALNTVGYQELFEYFDNKISMQVAIDLIKKNTRNYAKRQMTWFRREEGITWFDPKDHTGIIEHIERKSDS